MTTQNMVQKTYRDAIREAMREEMQRDERVLLLTGSACRDERHEVAAVQQGQKGDQRGRREQKELAPAEATDLQCEIQHRSIDAREEDQIDGAISEALRRSCEVLGADRAQLLLLPQGRGDQARVTHAWATAGVARVVVAPRRRGSPLPCAQGAGTAPIIP